MQVFTEEEVNAAKRIFKYWKTVNHPEISFEEFLYRDIQHDMLKVQSIPEPHEEAPKPNKPIYTERLDKYVDLTERLFSVVENKIDNLSKKGDTSNMNDVLTAYETFSRIYLNALELQKQNKEYKDA